MGMGSYPDHLRSTLAMVGLPGRVRRLLRRNHRSRSCRTFHHYIGLLAFPPRYNRSIQDRLLRSHTRPHCMCLSCTDWHHRNGRRPNIRHKPLEPSETRSRLWLGRNIGRRDTQNQIDSSSFQIRLVEHHARTCHWRGTDQHRRSTRHHSPHLLHTDHER